MGAYLIGRLAQAVLVVIGVVTFVFVMLNLTGDPARAMLPQTASEADIQNFRHQYGLDAPLYVQYEKYLTHVFQGDFGTSLARPGYPAMEWVTDNYPATAKLALTAFCVTLLVAFPLGIAAAVKPYSLVDNIVTFIALFGQSMPNFWLGIMLILLFAVSLHALPSGGFGNGGDPAHLILPAITLAVQGIGLLTRLVRSQMLEVLGEDYIRTARAKGQRELGVFVGHALKNAAIPLVTVLGLNIGGLLGGAVITETVFAWPGVGLLAISAINSHDFPVVQADVFVIATSFVLVNLIVDLLYGWLDPRIRLA
jgi:ABC-type dipeptide/oligopeptide/nickel transport system permease component